MCHEIRPMKPVALALLAACLAAGPGPAAAADAARGRALAQKNCSPCHAIGRNDASRNPRSPPFRTLSMRYDPDALQEALAEGISVGHEGAEMPEFVFSPAQIDDLIAHIRRITPRAKRGG